jgi:hypothetical protein
MRFKAGSPALPAAKINSTVENSTAFRLIQDRQTTLTTQRTTLIFSNSLARYMHMCMDLKFRRNRMKKMLMLPLLLLIESALAASPPTSVDQLMGQYFLMQKSLAADSVNGVSQSAAGIVKISREAAVTESGAKAQLTAISEAAAKLNNADLKTARKEFGDLSDRVIAYLKVSGAKRNPPYQFYCPMVKKSWLQPDKQTRNPYYGSSMLTCGELVP